MDKMIIFEYGAMSSVWKLQAESKFTAYVAMVMHFNRNAHLIALYEPKEIIEGDSWINPFTGKISKRLDEIFGGEGAFDKYAEEHIDEIKKAYDSIEQIM